MNKKLIALLIISLILILGLITIINTALIDYFLKSDEEAKSVITDFEYVVEEEKEPEVSNYTIKDETKILDEINESPRVLSKEEECNKNGGTWYYFGDGCVDSCEKAKAKEPVACTAALTWGCECGPDKCWNFTTNECEPNIKDDEININIKIKNRSFYVGNFSNWIHGKETIEFDGRIYMINFPYNYNQEGYSLIINNVSYRVPCHKLIELDNKIFFGIQNFRPTAIPEMDYIYYYIGTNAQHFNPKSDSPYVCSQ